jgi:hypothetical protein
MNNQDFLNSVKREVKLRNQGDLLMAFQEGQDRAKRMEVARESISSPSHSRPLPAEGKNQQILRHMCRNQSYWL